MKKDINKIKIVDLDNKKFLKDLFDIIVLDLYSQTLKTYNIELLSLEDFKANRKEILQQLEAEKRGLC